MGPRGGGGVLKIQKVIKKKDFQKMFLLLMLTYRSNHCESKNI